MLKSIFRSHKKSKGSLATPSGRDAEVILTVPPSGGKRPLPPSIPFKIDEPDILKTKFDGFAISHEEEISHKAKSTSLQNVGNSAVQPGDGSEHSLPVPESKHDHRRNTLSTIVDKLGLSRSATKSRNDRCITASDLRQIGSSFEDISRLNNMRSQSTSDTFGRQNGVADKQNDTDHIFACPLLPVGNKVIADDRKQRVGVQREKSHKRHGSAASSPTALGGDGQRVVAGSLPNLSGGVKTDLFYCQDIQDFNENDLATPKVSIAARHLKTEQ